MIMFLYAFTFLAMVKSKMNFNLTLLGFHHTLHQPLPNSVHCLKPPLYKQNLYTALSKAQWY